MVGDDDPAGERNDVSGAHSESLMVKGIHFFSSFFLTNVTI